MPLLGTIPEDPAARDSVYAGTPLVVFEPEGPAAIAYRRLATTVTGVEVPVPADDDGDDETDNESTTTVAGSASDDDGREAAHDDVSSAITEAESDP